MLLPQGPGPWVRSMMMPVLVQAASQLGITDRGDPGVHDAIGLAEATYLDHPLMPAGRIGGLVVAPSPTGPIRGDHQAPVSQSGSGPASERLAGLRDDDCLTG